MPRSWQVWARSNGSIQDWGLKQCARNLIFEFFLSMFLFLFYLAMAVLVFISISDTLQREYSIRGFFHFFFQIRRVMK